MRTLTTTATATAAAAAICTTVTVTVTATAPAHLARAVGINALTCSHRPVECVNTKLSACARLSLTSVHVCVYVSASANGSGKHLPYGSLHSEH